MKKIFLLMIMAIGITLSSSGLAYATALSTNLVTDGDGAGDGTMAEDGNWKISPNWTKVMTLGYEDKWSVVKDLGGTEEYAPISPYDTTGGGNEFYDFFSNASGNPVNGRIYQDIPLSDNPSLFPKIDAGNIGLNAEIYIYKYLPTDTGSLEIQFFDGTNAQISVGPYQSSVTVADSWEKVTNKHIAVPANTRKIRVMLTAYLSTGQSFVDFDGMDVQLYNLPTLTAGAVSRISDTEATVKFTSNEAGQYYYAVVNAGASAPTIDTSGTGTACNTTEQTISVTTLTAGAKDIYIKVKDAADNVSHALIINIAPFVYTVTVSVTPPSQGAATGGGVFSAGQRVTLGATPNSGYNFAGWYNGATLVSPLPNYSFTATQNIDLTANFQTMPTGTLHVASALGGSVNLNGSGIIANYSNNFARGTQITLTAVPASGYTFGYWENMRNSSIVSTANTYDTYTGPGTDLTAVFFPVTSPFTVVFKDKSGKILKSTSVDSGASETAPLVPTLLGYTANGWDKGFSNVTSNLMITAAYQREATTYALTVQNGTLSGSGTSGNYQFDTSVTVVARTAASGEQFSHWEQNGIKVSSKSTYTFFMPKSNTTLTAVFVASTITLVNTPFITLSNLQSSSNMLLVTAKRDVPVGYTLVESGVLLLQADSCSDLALNTTGAIRINTGAYSTDQFYIRKSGISGKWYARGYLIYKDGSGNIVTVYSDNILNATI